MLTIRERLGDEFQQLIVLTDFVELYTLQQEYPAAIDIAEQALALDPHRRYGRQLAKLSLCMGDVHWACHNYEAALESYLEACRYGAAVPPQDYKKAVVGSLSILEELIELEQQELAQKLCQQADNFWRKEESFKQHVAAILGLPECTPSRVQNRISQIKNRL